MKNRSRRHFLQQSMMASATMYATAQASQLGLAQQPEKKASPNEKLTVAVVGVNGRGGEHIGQFGKHPETVISHICDVDESVGQRRCDQIAKDQDGKRPTWVGDIRKLLEDKSIDIVSIATPNHWHSLGALWAVQAGKDVYVEKPVSHNVFEGRQVVKAARKENRIVQTGTQSRSNTGMREAMQFIHTGGIGQVKIARGLCYKPRGSIGPKGTYPNPPGIDYDLWLGPAPLAPVTRPKFHYDWHWQWAYGNGDLGNQGIHQMDLCRWALNKNELSSHVFSYGGRFGYEDAGETANTQIVVHTFGEQQLVFEVRGLKTEEYKQAKVGIIVEGTNGYVVMTSYSSGLAFDKDGNQIKRFTGGGDGAHFDNFVQAVKARDHQLLNADIEQGHYSSALCHTGNISLRLGKQVPGREIGNYLKDISGPENHQDCLVRTIEHLEDNGIQTAELQVSVGPNLEFDPKKERFTQSAEANDMLSREYRKPFVVPEIT